MDFATQTQDDANKYANKYDRLGFELIKIVRFVCFALFVSLCLFRFVCFALFVSLCLFRFVCFALFVSLCLFRFVSEVGPRFAFSDGGWIGALKKIVTDAEVDDAEVDDAEVDDAEVDDAEVDDAEVDDEQWTTNVDEYT